MRKTILILAAVTAVGSAYGYRPVRDAIGDLVDATRSANAPAAVAEAPPIVSLAPAIEPSSRVFSSGQPLLTGPLTPPTKPAVQAAQNASEPTLLPPSTVASDGGTSASSTRRLSSSRPADDDARRELVQDLQRELKRVGCYEGDINGTWAPAAKKAMASFTARVNATLPLEEPDYILLTLVQGQKARVCGGCPSGQSLNKSNQCVPLAVIARAERESAVPAPVATAQSSKTNKRTANSSSWATVVTPAPVPTPSKESPPLLSEAAPATRSPLPGRMAIGAPIDTPLPLPGPALSERDTLRAEMAKRKAELAAAESQRAAIAENERKARIEAALAKKAAREASAKQADANPRTGKKIESKAAPSTSVAASKPVPVTTPPAASSSQTQVASRQPRQAAVRPQPLPRGAMQGYSGPVVIVTPGPSPAPRPGYVPQPNRWTRNIFSDFNTLR